MTSFPRVATLLSLAVAMTGTAAAQDAPVPVADTPAAMPAALPPATQMTLELNGADDSGEAGCRVTLVATSQLAQALERAAWQIAVFGADGRVESLPVLDFGAMPAGKTRVAVFDLPGPPCAGIVRVVVNDVAECRAEDGTDLRGACLGGLATRNRTGIDFGL